MVVFKDSLKALNLALEIFANWEGSLDVGSLLIELGNHDIEVDFITAEEMTYKLLNDGYIRQTHPKLLYCTVSFTGHLFYQKGGYVAEYESLNVARRLNEERIEKSEKNELNALNLAKKLNRLTAGLIVAALIALAWDIYKYYNPRTSLPAKHYIEQTVLTKMQ